MWVNNKTDTLSCLEQCSMSTRPLKVKWTSFWSTKTQHFSIVVLLAACLGLSCYTSIVFTEDTVFPVYTTSKQVLQWNVRHLLSQIDKFVFCEETQENLCFCAQKVVVQRTYEFPCCGINFLLSDLWSILFWSSLKVTQGRTQKNKNDELFKCSSWLIAKVRLCWSKHQEVAR